MKLSVKTLKGELFQVEAELTDLVSEVKAKIAAVRPDLAADRQKLIHSGKVLKDETPMQETGVTEADFLVCMVTKEAPKKPVAATSTTQQPVGAPTTTNVQSSGQAQTPSPVTTSNATATSNSSNSFASTTTTTTPSLFTTPQTPPVVNPTNQQAPVSQQAVQQLTEMGFAEADVTAALRAANGNSDLAVEFLMSGIPDQAQLNRLNRGPPAIGGGNNASTPVAAQPEGIEQLRRHPQFNQLKALVQQNPAALGQVLEAIGQQNPELLRIIHGNQAAFLEMMNEPIVESDASAATPMATDDAYGDDNDMEGEPNPIQLMAMLQALPPQMRAQAAASIGISPEQLEALNQMLASLPPQQLQQLMGEAGRAGGARGAGGAGAPPGSQVIRLTEEEMGSVTRLQELGFDQQDVLAAFIACDRNEALAANLLLEGWTAGDDAGNDHTHS